MRASDASRQIGMTPVHQLADVLVRLLVYGTIGDATGHEFLAWVAAMDLPDPEAVLADPHDADRFVGMRPDRVHATLQGLLAAFAARRTARRWTAAVTACSTAASVVGLDAAVPVIRALMRIRPAKAELPPGLDVFAACLSLAGLLDAPGQ